MVLLPKVFSSLQDSSEYWNWSSQCDLWCLDSSCYYYYYYYYYYYKTGNHNKSYKTDGVFITDLVHSKSKWKHLKMFGCFIQTTWGYYSPNEFSHLKYHVDFIESFTPASYWPFSPFYSDTIKTLTARLTEQHQKRRSIFTTEVNPHPRHEELVCLDTVIRASIRKVSVMNWSRNL